MIRGVLEFCGKFKGSELYWTLLGIILLCHFRSVCPNFVYDYNDGYLSDLGASQWNSVGSRSVHPPRCVRIPTNLTLCRNVVYENMSLPNLLGHDSLEEIRRQAQPWVPLKNLRCHPNTDLFLCSLYAPVCLDRPIYPCRSLCEAVRDGCEARMNRYNYSWPDILRCDKFPLDDDLCIKQVNFTNDRGADPEETAANVCIPCKQPLTYESLLDSYCWAQFVIKGSIENVTIDQNGDKRLHLRKSKFFKSTNMTKREKKLPLQVTITSGSHCECDDAIASKKKKQLIMGSKQGNRLVVTYISDWKRSRKGESGKEFKKATRAMRKGHDCRAQIQEIAGQTDANNGGLSTNVEPAPESETNIEADLADTLGNTKRRNKNKNKGKGKKDKKRKGKDKKRKGKRWKKGKDKNRKGKGNRKNRNNENNNDNNNSNGSSQTTSEQ